MGVDDDDDEGNEKNENNDGEDGTRGGVKENLRHRHARGVTSGVRLERHRERVSSIAEEAGIEGGGRPLSIHFHAASVEKPPPPRLRISTRLFRLLLAEKKKKKTIKQ